MNDVEYEVDALIAWGGREICGILNCEISIYNITLEFRNVIKIVEIHKHLFIVKPSEYVARTKNYQYELIYPQSIVIFRSNDLLS